VHIPTRGRLLYCGRQAVHAWVIAVCLFIPLAGLGGHRHIHICIPQEVAGWGGLLRGRWPQAMGSYIAISSATSESL